MNLSADTLTDEEAAAAQPPLPPEQIAPHFPQLEILECLGRGGMGVVYKARQRSLNRLVALKLLAPERVRDAKFAERFSREAQALAALNHPHIVTVHDFGAVDAMSSAQTDSPAAHSRIYFLLMEFVDGVNLRAAMKAGRFTPEQALAVVPPVCEALQYAHEHGIVHRDIKPENLLLDKEGRVKIADFGVAKMLGMEASDAGAAQSQPAGTPQYMAPEQKDHQHTDHRADIYSLGVVLYEMLTGELPSGQLQPPSSRLRGMQIDVRLDEIVLRALEKEPELRFQTAGDFRIQLETVTHGSPRYPSSPPATARWKRLAPALVFIFLYAALVCFVARSASLLPEGPPIHFDGDGNANGWMNRSTYLLLICALPLLVAALFWLAAQRAKFFPGLLNIPRRDYWLAPERRAETAAFLVRWLLWLACVLTVFIGGLHALVIQANRLNPPRWPPGPLLGLVVAFLLVQMIWIATLMMRMAEAGDRKTTRSHTQSTRSYWLGAGMIGALGVLAVSYWLTRAGSPPTGPAGFRTEGRDDARQALTPVPADIAEQTSKRENIAGIGVALGRKNGRIIVGSLMPDSGAARDGRLKPGDIIAKAGEGTDSWASLDGMKLEDAVAIMRGVEGSRLALFVIPAGKGAEDAYTLTLIRKRIQPLAQAAYEAALEELVETQRQLALLGGEPGRQEPERIKRTKALEEKIRVLRAQCVRLRLATIQRKEP
jgi:predicted Ser/Thr protein kinase